MGGDLLNHRWHELTALRADCSSEKLRPRHSCSSSGPLGAGWGPRWRGAAEARPPGSCQLARRWAPPTSCTRPLRRGLEDPPPLSTLQMWRAHPSGVGMGGDDSYSTPSSALHVPHHACRRERRLQNGFPKMRAMRSIS